jgi:predicted RNA-binding protein associated with RNAse of E/G family
MTTREDAKAWDVRTLERKLRKGLITKKDYEKYLKGLPDKSENIAPPETDDGDRDDD